MKPAHTTLPDSRTASALCEPLFRGARAVGCFFLFVIIIASAHAQSARTTQSDNSLIAQRVATLRGVSDVLRTTAASPLPRGLSTAEFAEAQRYVAWLQASVARLDKLAAKGESAIGGGGQEMQMSFNLQYLQLQSSMQDENRKFSMVSNIMKTKHDTVKNSIGKIR